MKQKKKKTDLWILKSKQSLSPSSPSSPHTAILILKKLKIKCTVLHGSSILLGIVKTKIQRILGLGSRVANPNSSSREKVPEAIGQGTC